MNKEVRGNEQVVGQRWENKVKLRKTRTTKNFQNKTERNFKSKHRK